MMQEIKFRLLKAVSDKYYKESIGKMAESIYQGNTVMNMDNYSIEFRKVFEEDLNTEMSNLVIEEIKNNNYKALKERPNILKSVDDKVINALISNEDKDSILKIVLGQIDVLNATLKEKLLPYFDKEERIIKNLELDGSKEQKILNFLLINDNTKEEMINSLLRKSLLSIEGDFSQGIVLKNKRDYSIIDNNPFLSKELVLEHLKDNENHKINYNYIHLIFASILPSKSILSLLEHYGLNELERYNFVKDNLSGRLDISADLSKSLGLEVLNIDNFVVLEGKDYYLIDVNGFSDRKIELLISSLKDINNTTKTTTREIMVEELNKHIDTPLTLEIISEALDFRRAATHKFKDLTQNDFNKSTYENIELEKIGLEKFKEKMEGFKDI